MKDFVIEKDVPLPSGGAHNRRWPWREMEVGDSVLISPEDGETTAQLRNRMSGSLIYAHPRKFTTRTIGKQIRVWRRE